MKLLRLERSRAQTHKGLKRPANAIKRDTIKIPLTHKQRAEQKTQQPKLDQRKSTKTLPCPDGSLAFSARHAAKTIPWLGCH
jgi:hypothetical protein